jgi:hypothetical protein
MIDVTSHFNIAEDNKDKVDVIKELYAIDVKIKRVHKNANKHDDRNNCPICNTVLVDANEHNCMLCEIPNDSSINWTTVDAEAEARHDAWLESEDILCDFNLSATCNCSKRKSSK